MTVYLFVFHIYLLVEMSRGSHVLVLQNVITWILCFSKPESGVVVVHAPFSSEPPKFEVGSWGGKFYL